MVYLAKIIRVAALAVLVCVAWQMPARAQRTPPSDTFEIGVEGQWYQYREPDFAKLEGPGVGLEGTYTYNWSNYFVRANVIADFYDLQYSSNGTGTENGVSDYKQDYRAMFGYNIKTGKATTVWPYIGFGYRMLFDANGENISSTGAEGYDRRSQYLYIPLGAGITAKAGRWGVRSFAEFDYLVQGYQTSYLRDLGYDNNVHNTQNTGYGIRAGLMISPPINFYNFSVGPYARYWNINNSDVKPLYIGGVEVATGLEPANNTLEYGLEASIRFQ